MSLPSVSYGNNVNKADILKDRKEKSKNGKSNSYSYSFAQIHGIKIPPVLPIQLAIPIPVVLILVE